MFESFFPRPKLFFLSAVAFAAVAIAAWYLLAADFVRSLSTETHVVGLTYFVAPQFILFYAYFAACGLVFMTFWFVVSPHPWQWWSIAGSILIIFSTSFSVQVAVALNVWRRPFFDAVQQALSGNSTVTASDLYGLLLVFAEIAFVWVGIYVLTRFLVSHFVFRWRTAMTDHYMTRWPEVRHIEGAAQRIQEDTMRFATIVEDLGISIIESLMTLLAFLPVLSALSTYVTGLPVAGRLPEALLVASIAWSLFGTALLAVAGVKLPGLNFDIQRVEAGYRKELVFGEDDADRARPPTVRELFSSVRRSYFRLYFHYAYFNIFRAFYLQADNIYAYFILIPSIAGGVITFGILQQILTAFAQVSNAFQYLVNSWTTIVELLSIHKRLSAFEAAFSARRGADAQGLVPKKPVGPRILSR